MSGTLLQAFIYLAAAVIAVPIANRLGLGSVLGYLIAGVVIGPVVGLVGAETQAIQHVAEFGVVMMLFLVGLELEPKKLWEMRTKLLGLGGLQVGVTAALVTALGMALGLDWRAAIGVSLVFALSSTAIVLQTLSEKGLTKTEGGNASFSVLLFQDIAVIGMLALMPLLASPELAAAAADAAHHDDGHHSVSLVANLPGWAYALTVLAAVAAVVAGGHYISRPLFRFIAHSKLREIFTAAALLLVVGIALLMTLVELSPALGTFLAGVVLANSEYRHELESDVEPFKGLLLGLFFITVGAGVDFDVLTGAPGTILGLTFGLIALKAAVLFGLYKMFKLAAVDGWLFTLGLAQAGEFGFVLLAFGVQEAVFAPELTKTISLVVALSMLFTPALFIIYEKLLMPRIGGEEEREADVIDEQGTVIIAGIGRFGQIVNRMLVSAGVRTVVLDLSANMMELLAKVGIKSFYGDATRPELLHAAGIEHADMVVVAIDDRERAVELVKHVKHHYPHVAVLARAFDVRDQYALHVAGADFAKRELFDSSLEVAMQALKRLGHHPYAVEKMGRAFRKHDEDGIKMRFEMWDQDPEFAGNPEVIRMMKEHLDRLTDVMALDSMVVHDRSERAWTPPPKGYTSKLAEAEQGVEAAEEVAPVAGSSPSEASG